MLLLSSVPTQAEKPTIITQSFIDVNGDGQKDSVTIIMVSGKRYRDQDWCGAGDKYEGVFHIVVQIQGGKTVEQNLNTLFDESLGNKMFFKSGDWQIQFDDYNRDGRVDFNIGQYGSCNGWVYKLFTIVPSGQIVPLEREERGHFVADSRNSTSKIYTNKIGFYYTYYDNTAGGLTTAYYVWDKTRKKFHRQNKVANQNSFQR